MTPATRANDIQSVLQEARVVLDQLLRTTSLKLPPLPQVAAQVLAAAERERADVMKVSNLIHSDQALAAYVLRMANSPLYLPRQEIVSLQQAVTRLGFRTLCEIALSATLGGQVFRVPGCEALASQLWRHSLASGAFAREIARMRRSKVEGAFLCGLLHGIGKPVLLQLLSSTEREYPQDLLAVIMEEEHARVGVLLAERWRLPPAVRVVIQYQGCPAKSPSHHEEVATTLLATHLATGLLEPDHELGDELRSHPAVVALNLYPDNVRELEAMGEQVRQMVAVLA